MCCAGFPFPLRHARIPRHGRAGCARAASAIWPAKVSSRCRCSGSRTRRRLSACTASTPSVVLEPESGRYSAGAAGSVSEPRPARRSWSATHWAIDRSAPRSEHASGMPSGCRRRPFSPGSRITALLSKTSATCVTATRARLGRSRVCASSRLIAYSSAVRRSRAPATRVCCRTLAISVAMTMVTISITENVTRYCTSLTASVKRGGTNAKLSARMLASAAATAGPRPRRNPAIAAPSMYTITTSVSSKWGYMRSPTPVQTAVPASALA